MITQLKELNNTEVKLCKGSRYTDTKSLWIRMRGTLTFDSYNNCIINNGNKCEIVFHPDMVEEVDDNVIFLK